ncbi:Coiled-coil-helix-coiled-coil-helix domain-containing protein 7 [Madurella fahalii]|uniref:Coiled-coil-helix-coiled-coil-helix domain-containing protein 7 n=1 Tax=Madurella fahalii TaxID=1157608 RepID=A0ABQ0GI11_9PEZI
MASTADSSSAEPWNRETKDKFESKDRSEFLDPCQDVAARSIRCLHRNGGDRSFCGDYFQAYRDCKKAWIEKRRMGSRGSSSA